MRKVFVGLVTILSLALISTQLSQAAVIPGAKCSKTGATSIFQGKKYTCVKSVKGSVWNKGVGILKPLPIATPNPVASPSPSFSATPTPSASFEPVDGDAPLRAEGCGTGTFYYRMNDGSMERSFFPDKNFNRIDSRSESKFNPIRAKAFKSVREHFLSNNKIQARIQSNVSPTFPKDLLVVLQKQLVENVAFWQEYFPSNATVQATYFTGDDPNFANNSMQTMSGPLEPYYLEELRKLKQYNCSLVTGISGAHLVNQGPRAGQSGYWFGANSPPQETMWAPGYQPHELTHSVQALIVKDVFSVTLPVNFFEGGAEFFGLAMGFTNLGWYSDEVDRRLIEKDMNEFIMDIKNKDDVMSMLQLTEVNPGPIAGGSAVPNAMRWSYSMGNLLWEWVTAEYGFQAYWEILKSINQNRSYEQSIQKVLGISKMEMYEKASPYLLIQIKTALAKNWKSAWKQGS